MADNNPPKSRSMIDDKNKFMTEASQVALHALIVSSTIKNRDPKGLAQQARKYAVELWLAMRAEP